MFPSSKQVLSPTLCQAGDSAHITDEVMPAARPALPSSAAPLVRPAREMQVGSTEHLRVWPHRGPSYPGDRQCESKAQTQTYSRELAASDGEEGQVELRREPGARPLGSNCVTRISGPGVTQERGKALGFRKSLVCTLGSWGPTCSRQAQVAQQGLGGIMTGRQAPGPHQGYPDHLL